ncbi:nose resistant to fluoxetine protein 6-like isoform X2 [Chironomus tepperi]|uniref:nose resistant to fluoxetine protein 6-like isoform X2 n=1 Tax=Chironomus tepperi TaxID=113505 RepID=UPI00391EE76D
MAFNDSLCQTQLDYFNASLSKREFWAMQMLDMYAKLPPGILHRNVRQFGLFTECLNLKHTAADDTVGLIQGQYCTITHTSSSSGSPIDSDRLEWRDIGLLARSRNLRFESGICIPDTCSEDRAKFYANSILKNADLRAIAAFCQQNEKIVLSALDYFVLVMLGLLVLIVISSTIYEKWTKKQSHEPKKIFTAFSLDTNIKELLHIDYRKSRNVIACMHGMRALAAFWIISGHRIFRDSRYMSRPINPSNIVATATLALLMTVDYAVDIFFLLSAILVAQSCLRALDGKKLNLGKIYFNRYMRYTPSMAVLLLFILTFLPYALVNGPAIQLLTINVERCQKYWWSTLLMIQNYVNVDQVCLGHVWYLNADFQLYLMSPIFIYIAWKLRYKSFWIFGVVLAAVQISIFFVRYYDIVKEEVVYRQTHFRIGQWLVGISLGYIMYQMKDDTSEYRIRKRIRYTCWILTASALISTEIYYQLLRTEAFPRAFYEATHRIIFTCFIGWIVFSFHYLKSEAPISKILSFYLK